MQDRNNFQFLEVEHSEESQKMSQKKLRQRLKNKLQRERFHLFPNLPPELRCQIWLFSMPRRSHTLGQWRGRTKANIPLVCSRKPRVLSHLLTCTHQIVSRQPLPRSRAISRPRILGGLALSNIRQFIPRCALPRWDRSPAPQMELSMAEMASTSCDR